MIDSKYYLSWKWVEDQIDSTVDRFEEKEFLFVSGVPRGGLIPAVMMSHILGIKYLPYTSAILLPEEDRKQTLVIDDIADTGHTLLEAKELGFITFTLALRSTSEVIPTYNGEYIVDERWLVFPWETLDSESKQDYLINNES